MTKSQKRTTLLVLKKDRILYEKLYQKFVEYIKNNTNYNKKPRKTIFFKFLLENARLRIAEKNFDLTLLGDSLFISEFLELDKLEIR